jgi:hypothetical protein
MQEISVVLGTWTIATCTMYMKPLFAPISESLQARFGLS